MTYGCQQVAVAVLHDGRPGDVGGELGSASHTSWLRFSGSGSGDCRRTASPSPRCNSRCSCGPVAGEVLEQGWSGSSTPMPVVLRPIAYSLRLIRVNQCEFDDLELGVDVDFACSWSIRIAAGPDRAQLARRHLGRACASPGRSPSRAMISRASLPVLGEVGAVARHHGQPLGRHAPLAVDGGRMRATDPRLAFGEVAMKARRSSASAIARRISSLSNGAVSRFTRMLVLLFIGRRLAHRARRLRGDVAAIAGPSTSQGKVMSKRPATKLSIAVDGLEMMWNSMPSSSGLPGLK